MTGNPAAEGTSCVFTNEISNIQSFSVFGGLKCEKLVKYVIKVINGVPTTYLWRKNEEKGPILRVISID